MVVSVDPENRWYSLLRDLEKAVTNRSSPMKATLAGLTGWIGRVRVVVASDDERGVHKYTAPERPIPATFVPSADHAVDHQPLGSGAVRETAGEDGSLRLYIAMPATVETSRISGVVGWSATVVTAEEVEIVQVEEGLSEEDTGRAYT